MPTAPEIAPIATPSKAAARRCSLRCASKASPASFTPKVVGSAWTPCVRPTLSVSTCSRARAASAVDQLARAGEHDLAGVAQRQRERGVEDVGGGQPVVDPAPRRPGRLREHVDEGGDVVVGDLLALGDRLDARARGADRLELRLAGPVHLLAGGDLDPPPVLDARRVRPQRADLRSRVAVDHAGPITPPWARRPSR